ncbi:MAG TPA: CARDB domain-containing protein [Thermoanaerobaculia bacterium]|nr:CARDB domain-containing protein [Thermoanaerobaculia bacterium]
MSLLLLLLLAAAPEGAPAPDLEIVALQTTGPGRIGDCNAVVARLHNRGSAPTAEAPAVRLEVSGSQRWSQTATAATPLAPGATAEVWFQRVPLPAGLSRVEAISDPEGRVGESDENNNTRQVPRDPQLACGVADPPATPAIELRVLVTAPIAGVVIEVASPMRAGAVLASATTAADGRATLTVPPDPRSPVLRVTASAPGCPPAVRLATPTAGQTPLDLTIELSCPIAPSAAGQQRPGVLEIETALPGLLQIDDETPAAVTFGTKLTLERPGARVRLRQSSANGTSFYDRTVDVPRDATRREVIDAPVLRGIAADPSVVEDLRSGLLWSVGAATTTGQPAASAICESLERGGNGDWRLPEIDELAFVLEAPGGVPLLGLSDCCLWSSTEHAGLRLTFYVEGGHIYGRGADQGGVGALCARGAAHVADPLLVPERYRDRLPGNRRFRPRD